MEDYGDNDWMYNDDFDHEEDIARLEHYKLHGNKPMLMPDLNNITGDNYGRFGGGRFGGNGSSGRFGRLQ